MTGHIAASSPLYVVTPSRDQMLKDVREGLTQTPKQLSPKYFYDERGSRLFEEITRVPEYYLTRAERALLDRHIPHIIGELRPRSLVELGAGSASKTRIILDAMRASGAADFYVPIDVSGDFLESAATLLRNEYPDTRISPVVSDITAPFDLPGLRHPVLFAFLGSTIGNFSRSQASAFLSYVRRLMNADDAFLLGADLKKDPEILNAAYNDAAGVTAEFNLNLLTRLNRELGADFPVRDFAHRAYYSSEHSRIEMHVVAARDLEVRIPGMETVKLAKGETIRTEVSYKYDRDAVEGILRDSGMRLERWITDEDHAFSLALARAAPIT